MRRFRKGLHVARIGVLEGLYRPDTRVKTHVEFGSTQLKHLDSDTRLALGSWLEPALSRDAMIRDGACGFTAVGLLARCCQ